MNDKAVHSAYLAAMERIQQRLEATEKSAEKPQPAGNSGGDLQSRGVAGEAARAATGEKFNSQLALPRQPAVNPYLAERIEKIVAGLNPRQYEAVVYEGAHLLVVAGAGSGKTRVLTTRIGFLIASGKANAEQILAITFTNKAAKEMRARLATMLGAVGKGMWISTFHSACVRILRAEHDKLEIRSAFTIYDTADSRQLLKIVCAEENIDSNLYKPSRLLNRISKLKNEMVSATEAAERAQSRDELVTAQAYLGYQQRLRAANAMDFDDLIMNTVLLFRRHPEVLNNYRQRFRYVLVDEYQDTNISQYELIKLLAGDSRKPIQQDPFLGDTPAVSLTVVGDADQSIYAFRGATISNIENFSQDFPGAQTVLLEQNYRSTQNILTAANAVISNNSHRQKKNLWTELGAGEKLTGYASGTEKEEAKFVAEEIADLVDSGYAYGDIAIFYRTNAQSRAFEDQLVHEHIPYQVVGGTKFYDRKEIKDALAYLQAVANPDDTVSMRRILNEPKRGLGAKTEELLAAHARQWGISFGAALEDALGETAREVVGISPRAQKKIQELWDLLVKARKRAKVGDSPVEILDDVLDESGYLDILQNSKDPQDAARLENLAELRAVAEEFRVAELEGTLQDFLSQLALVADTDQLPAEEDKGEVVLMTVHTAKGLEFPVVFATGFEDGTFPHNRSKNSPEELAEERRLAYVALTRARRRLYITFALRRMQWGAPQDLLPSPFIAEIPEEVITWCQQVDEVPSGDFSSSYRSYGRRDIFDGYREEDFAPPIGSGRAFVPGRLDGGTENEIHSVRRVNRNITAGSEAEGRVVASAASSASRLSPRAASEKTGGRVQKSLAEVNSAAAASNSEEVKQSSASRRATLTPQTGGLKISDRVIHKTFGKGEILEFTGSGKSTVAVVKFTSGATKRLLLRYAPLEKYHEAE